MKKVVSLIMILILALPTLTGFAETEVAAKGTPINVEGTSPGSFLQWFHSSLDAYYGQYFGGSSEAKSVIENMKLDPTSAEISETDIEGVYQINISGALTGISFVCTKENDYLFSRAVYGFSTEGEDMMRLFLPSAFAFTTAVTVYANAISMLIDGDEAKHMELVQTQYKELSNKFGVQKGMGALSVDDWSSDYKTDTFTIHFEKDEENQIVSFVADFIL